MGYVCIITRVLDKQAKIRENSGYLMPRLPTWSRRMSEEHVTRVRFLVSAHKRGIVAVADVAQPRVDKRTRVESGETGI